MYFLSNMTGSGAGSASHDSSRGEFQTVAVEESEKKDIQAQMVKAIDGFGAVDDCYRLVAQAKTAEAKDNCIGQLLQIDNPILSQDFINQMEEEGWKWLLDHDLRGYAANMLMAFQAVKMSASRKEKAKRENDELTIAAICSLESLALEKFVKFWPTYKSIMEGIFRGKLLVDSTEGFETSKANYRFKASDAVGEVENYVNWLKEKNAGWEKIEIQNEIGSEEENGGTVEIDGYKGLIVNSILNKIRNSARDIVAAKKIIFKIYIDKKTGECVFAVKDDGTGMAEGRLDYKNKEMFAYGPASGSGSTGSGLNRLPEEASAVGASVECITRTRGHNPKEWTRFISVPDNNGKPIYKDAETSFKYPGGVDMDTGTVMRLRFPVVNRRKMEER